VCGRKKALAAQVRATAAAGAMVVVAVADHAADRRAVTVMAKAMAAHVRPSHVMIL
jgi:hypothetical protein